MLKRRMHIWDPMRKIHQTWNKLKKEINCLTSIRAIWKPNEVKLTQHMEWHKWELNFGLCYIVSVTHNTQILSISWPQALAEYFFFIINIRKITQLLNKFMKRICRKIRSLICKLWSIFRLSSVSCGVGGGVIRILCILRIPLSILSPPCWTWSISKAKVKPIKQHA